MEHNDPTLDFLAKINDPKKYIRVPGVPIFVPHTRKTKGPNGEEIDIVVTAQDLPIIADQINLRENEYGVPPILTIGHRQQNDPAYPEHLQPDMVGVVRDAKVGNFGPKQTPAILATVYYDRESWEETKKYPFRSVDFYPNSNKVTGVALLKRDPFLPMGIVSYQDDLMHSVPYSSIVRAMEKKSSGQKYVAPSGGIEIGGYKFKSGQPIPPNYVAMYHASQYAGMMKSMKAKNPGVTKLERLRALSDLADERYITDARRYINTAATTKLGAKTPMLEWALKKRNITAPRADKVSDSYGKELAKSTPEERKALPTSIPVKRPLGIHDAARSTGEKYKILSKPAEVLPSESAGMPLSSFKKYQGTAPAKYAGAASFGAPVTPAVVKPVAPPSEPIRAAHSASILKDPAFGSSARVDDVAALKKRQAARGYISPYAGNNSAKIDSIVEQVTGPQQYAGLMKGFNDKKRESLVNFIFDRAQKNEDRAERLKSQITAIHPEKGDQELLRKLNRKLKFSEEQIPALIFRGAKVARGPASKETLRIQKILHDKGLRAETQGGRLVEYPAPPSDPYDTLKISPLPPEAGKSPPKPAVQKPAVQMSGTSSLRAPKGGIEIGGHHFKSGHHIPPSFARSMTDEQKSQCMGQAKPVQYAGWRDTDTEEGHISGGFRRLGRGNIGSILGLGTGALAGAGIAALTGNDPVKGALVGGGAGGLGGFAAGAAGVGRETLGDENSDFQRRYGRAGVMSVPGSIAGGLIGAGAGAIAGDMRLGSEIGQTAGSFGGFGAGAADTGRKTLGFSGKKKPVSYGKFDAAIGKTKEPEQYSFGAALARAGGAIAKGAGKVARNPAVQQGVSQVGSAVASDQIGKAMNHKPAEYAIPAPAPAKVNSSLGRNLSDRLSRFKANSPRLAESMRQTAIGGLTGAGLTGLSSAIMTEGQQPGETDEEYNRRLMTAIKQGALAGGATGAVGGLVNSFGTPVASPQPTSAAESAPAPTAAPPIAAAPPQPPARELSPAEKLLDSKRAELGRAKKGIFDVPRASETDMKREAGVVGKELNQLKREAGFKIPTPPVRKPASKPNVVAVPIQAATSGPPAADPKTGIINPKPSNVPGISSGAVAVPAVKPTPKPIPPAVNRNVNVKQTVRKDDGLDLLKADPAPKQVVVQPPVKKAAPAKVEKSVPVPVKKAAPARKAKLKQKELFNNQSCSKPVGYATKPKMQNNAGGIVGAVGGGAAGAALGMLGGPIAPITSTIGGVAGGYLGEKLGSSMGGKVVGPVGWVAEKGLKAAGVKDTPVQNSGKKKPVEYDDDDSRLGQGVIGTVGGGLVGGLAGLASGNALGGALIGGASGGLTGAATKSGLAGTLGGGLAGGLGAGTSAGKSLGSNVAGSIGNIGSGAGGSPSFSESIGGVTKAIRGGVWDMAKDIGSNFKDDKIWGHAKTLGKGLKNAAGFAGKKKPVSYAAERAPVGGVTLQGKKYIGGQFIPSEVIESATPEEREKLKKAKDSGLGHPDVAPTKEPRKASNLFGLAGRKDVPAKPLSPELKQTVSDFIADAPPEYQKELQQHLHETLSGHVGDFISNATPEELHELNRKLLMKIPQDMPKSMERGPRAPKGGIELEGQKFGEGDYIPPTFVQRATPEQRAKIVQTKSPVDQLFGALSKPSRLLLGEPGTTRNKITKALLATLVVAAGKKMIRGAFAGDKSNNQPDTRMPQRDGQSHSNPSQPQRPALPVAKLAPPPTAKFAPPVQPAGGGSTSQVAAPGGMFGVSADYPTVSGGRLTGGLGSMEGSSPPAYKADEIPATYLDAMKPSLPISCRAKEIATKARSFAKKMKRV